MEIKVNNITLHYTKEGQGSPLILLHGNGEDHSIFAALIEKLKTHFTIYAIDSRNHGQSSQTKEFNYEVMAEDTYLFIQKLGLTDVSILGFSDGGIIAIIMELQHPSIFKKMILLGTHLHPSYFKEECMTYLKEEYAKNNDPLFKMMLEEPNIPLDSLKAIKTPSLIIWAENDLFQDSLYDEIRNTISNAQYLTIKGHDHGSYIINSDILYDDVMKFL